MNNSVKQILIIAAAIVIALIVFKFILSILKWVVLGAVIVGVLYFVGKARKAKR
jgi:hypothetical protein